MMQEYPALRLTSSGIVSTMRRGSEIQATIFQQPSLRPFILGKIGRLLSRNRGRQALVAAFVALMVIWLGGCVTLDRKTPRSPSAALTAGEAKATTLGGAWSAIAPDDPNLSAFRALLNGLEAFAARVALIDAAERTLDLQYYIFHSDDTGLFLIDRLVTAADRGVRVRILIDDMYAHGIEKGLAQFDAHPNIELRLFNPWTNRSGKLMRGLEFLFTPRLNHRMHNKMFIADGTVAILGGRNLADEYLGSNSEFDFRDLDVAAVGPVAAEADELFDDFWNGADAIPVTGLKPRPNIEAQFDDARTRLESHREKMKDTPYADAVRSTEFVQQLKTRSLHWIFAPGKVVGDAPEKTVHAGDAEWTHNLADALREPFYSAKKELLVSSPYFVPGKKAVDRLCNMAAAGVDVRFLTNSLAANDVPIAHAGYSKYRKRLTAGGVVIHELRHRGVNAPEDEEDKPAYGSSNSSLHAKSFVIDRQQVFIGSLNLDPRSVVLNTEVGVFIDSPELAESVAASISSLMTLEWSYRLEISDKGKLIWVGVDAAGNPTRFTDDPDTSFWQRLKVVIMRMLPVESQI